MTYLEITDDDKINVEKIDNQHQKMIDILNDMHKYLLSNNKTLKLELFKSFLQVLNEHFTTEEFLMSEQKFVNYFSHKQEHERMLKKMQDFYKELRNNENEINLELLKSIKVWFFNHNKLNDIKMGLYLNSKGIF